MVGYDAWHCDDMEAVTQEALTALGSYCGLSITMYIPKRDPFRISPVRMLWARVSTIMVPA